MGPPVPVESNCSFQNSTTYTGHAYKQLTVDVNDYTACCELCLSDPDCVVAQMHHGTGLASVDLCRLLGTAEHSKSNMVSPPALEMACIPKRSRMVELV